MEKDQTKEKVIDLLRTNMGVEEPRLETAFRLGRKQEHNTRDTPILIRFKR